MIIAQFARDGTAALVPYLGVASAVFRCGTNIVLVAFAATLPGST